MAVAIITGSGSYVLENVTRTRLERLETPWGPAEVTHGRLAGIDVLHVSRHGGGHRRLSNHVNHRANIAALKELGAVAVIATTVCGATDPGLDLGSLIVFDDLHFPSNRLPDGSLATLYDEPGHPLRGHWVYGHPFSPQVRTALLAAAQETGLGARDGGCYGHVDGPRFNTRTEIRALALLGVTAVSQTAGPETALAGDAELPYALLGFVTDNANGVGTETSIEQLLSLFAGSTARFAAVIEAALPRIAAAPPPAVGTILRFE